MSTLTSELTILIIDHLNLEDVDPTSVDPKAELFGEGLGLDSVDALELVMLMETNYGAKIENTNAGREAFATLETLANFVEQNRTK